MFLPLLGQGLARQAQKHGARRVAVHDAVGSAQHLFAHHT